MNLDEAREAIEVMDDQEIGRWFKSWIIGAGGKEIPADRLQVWSLEQRAGYAAGLASFADAQAYSEKQRERVSARYTKTLPEVTVVACGSYPEAETLTETLPIEQRTTNNEQRTEIKEQTPKPPKGEDLANAETIYAAYPLKAAKGSAIKAILKALTLETYETLLDAAKEYARATATWAKDERKYIAHPSTFFNQHRWQDDRAIWWKGKSDPVATMKKTHSSVGDWSLFV